MLASFFPSMGEILSIFAPPPCHSPSNTPALSSVSPSFEKTSCISSRGAHAPRVLVSAPSPKQSFPLQNMRRRGGFGSTRGRVRSPDDPPRFLSFGYLYYLQHCFCKISIASSTTSFVISRA